MKSLNKKNILVADNDPSIISIFDFILQQVGYPALTTSSGRRCLDLISQNPQLTLLFLDINLKDISGIELIKQIQKRNPNLLIMLMTGYGVDNILAPAFDLGIYGIIYKPFDIEEVIEILNTLFKKSPEIKSNA
ncbi:MAG: response regulator [Candidatus Margulisbacteria bacterium]|nr:response regulator [Candidatus Margulisiibacteriota bacterium]